MLGLTRATAALVAAFALSTGAGAAPGSTPNTVAAGNPSVAAAATHRLTGFVWFDAVADKSFSIWERKLPRVQVVLNGINAPSVTRMARTGPAGNFTIANLPAGAYRVTLVPPAGFTGGPAGRITVRADIVRNFRVTRPKSVEEMALNAFGDSWSLARRNSSLPRLDGTGCYRLPAPGMTSRFTAEELRFFASSPAPFYLEGCAEILETNPPFSEHGITSDMLKQRVAQFKKGDPARRYITYQQVVFWAVGSIGWLDIYNAKSWFVYKKGTTIQDLSNVVRGKNGSFLLDVTNPDYQDYITSRLAEALVDYNVDGLLFDTHYPVHMLADISEIGSRKQAAWQTGLLTLLSKLKAKLPPGKYVFVNAPRDFPVYSTRVVNIVDGVMLEDAFSPARGNVFSNIQKRKPIIDAAVKRGKLMFATVNTTVDGSTYATTTPKQEHILQRYYLAAFHIFKRGNMLYYNSPPTATSHQYSAQAFFTDWNVNVGKPNGPYHVVAGKPDLYVRTFQNSVVYLNNNKTETYDIVPPIAKNLDPDGRPVKLYKLPPKTAIILSNTAAFQ